MAYIFSKLAVAAWSDLGKIQTLHNFVATGGNTTTIINTAIAQRSDQPEDQYAVDMTAVVVKSTDSLAPEGELQRISAYDSATQTYTVDTAFSAGVGAGDRIVIADPDVPLQEMLRIANRALTAEVEGVEFPDTSLTMVDGKTEYTLPGTVISGRNILRVDRQLRNATNDNQWTPVAPGSWRFRPGANGGPGLLILDSDLVKDGYKIQLTIWGSHPDLTAYNSPVYIHPNLAIAATTAHVIQWLNSLSSGENDYWLQREAKAWTELDRQRVLHPVRATPRDMPWLNVR